MQGRQSRAGKAGSTRRRAWAGAKGGRGGASMGSRAAGSASSHYMHAWAGVLHQINPGWEARRGSATPSRAGQKQAQWTGPRGQSEADSEAEVGATPQSTTMQTVPNWDLECYTYL